MKPSIGKSTLTYLDSLEGRVEEEVVNYTQETGLDGLLLRNGLRIHKVIIEKEIDLLLIILNNRGIIRRSLSEFEILYKADLQHLQNFTNEGLGIHWMDLDYDLSLRGFLENEIVSTKGTTTTLF